MAARWTTTPPDVSLNGHGPVDADGTPAKALRRVRVTQASTVAPKPVQWLWDGRLALGTLGLLAGREGLGKSTLAYWVAARITRGELPGSYQDQARTVLVAATEDSWEHTIIPRLIAAGADLDLILMTEVVLYEDTVTTLSLPKDNEQLEQLVMEQDAALLLLDPLMSRLDGGLDSHKDAEVRQALEPLVAIADKAAAAVLGIMHFNKGSSGDPLTAVMGSRAFAAVARSVSTVVRDPEEEGLRVFGTPKNNLGRDDLPNLTFKIDSAEIDTDEGPAYTGAICWVGETDRTMYELMEDGADPGTSEAVGDAVAWLKGYMFNNGCEALATDCLAAGKAHHHTERNLRRALKRMKGTSKPDNFQGPHLWRLPLSVDSQT